MATGDAPRSGPGVASALDYFDAVLVAIPLVLLSPAAALRLAGLGWRLGGSVGGFVAMVVVGHALFVHTPGGGT